MSNLVKIIVKTYETLLNGLIAILASFNIILIILIAVQVFSRCFSTPVLWTADVARSMLIALSLPGAAWLLRNDDHINIDLVMNAFSKKKQLLINGIASVMGCVTCLLVTVIGTMVTYDQYTRNIIVEGDIHLPKYIILMLIPLGGFFLVVEFIRKVKKYFHEYCTTE